MVSNQEYNLLENFISNDFQTELFFIITTRTTSENKHSHHNLGYGKFHVFDGIKVLSKGRKFYQMSSCNVDLIVVLGYVKP